MHILSSALRRLFRPLVAICGPALFFLFAACNDGGGDGQPQDIGDNRAGVVLALGDSITNGVCVPAGAPYPSRVAAITNKTVINAGICGQEANQGAASINGLLQKHKPEALLVFLGSNDMIRRKPVEEVIAQLRAILQAAKANKTRVYITTLTPMYDVHSGFNPGVQAINTEIIKLAKSEKVGLVNLAKEFGTRRELIQEDGLHPSDMGTRIIAAAFADQL